MTIGGDNTHVRNSLLHTYNQPIASDIAICSRLALSIRPLQANRFLRSLETSENRSSLIASHNFPMRCKASAGRNPNKLCAPMANVPIIRCQWKMALTPTLAIARTAICRLPSASITRHNCETRFSPQCSMTTIAHRLRSVDRTFRVLRKAAHYQRQIIKAEQQSASRYCHKQ